MDRREQVIGETEGLEGVHPPVIAETGYRRNMEDLIDGIRHFQSKGDRADDVILAVEQITGSSAAEVRAAVDSLPYVILSGLSRMEAEVIEAWIKDAGGSLRLEG